MHRVIVIGSGMGGLAAAIDLARTGCEVTVLERAAGPGGKLREVTVQGTGIDAGPTVFTLRAVFESLFSDAGARLDEHLELVPADLIARHAWSTGGTLDLHADLERSVEAIGGFAGAAEARGYRDFVARGSGLLQALRGSFMETERPSAIRLSARLGAAGLAAMWRTPPWSSLWRELGDHFRDPRLRQLFGRYATYVGSSPFAAPATLMLIAHVEQQGVWLVKGGMRRIALALEDLGLRQGARYRYHTHVAQILTQRGRVTGVQLASGEVLEADAVVFNGDANALASGALGIGARSSVAAIPSSQRALSAVTWCLRAPVRGFDLAHHTVFFGDDYADEFRAIFARCEIARSPTVYVCAQDRGEAADSPVTPGSPERLLLLINAPADGDRGGVSEAALMQAGKDAFASLRRCGLELGTAHDSPEAVITRPQDFEALFPCTGGSLYGRANHGMLASFQRSGSRSKVPGLYLAGGSVHPGPGIPMATLSGRLAAAAVLQDAR